MSARTPGERLAWSHADQERLATFWAEGHSTAEIGRRLGITKNAVIGRAHRTNLPPRPSPIRPGVAPQPRKLKLKPERKLNVARSSVVLPVEKARAAAAVQVVQPVQHVQPVKGCGHCRFIVRWDADRPRNSVACDAPTSGSSWCAKHHRVVFSTRPAWFETNRQVLANA